MVALRAFFMGQIIKTVEHHYKKLVADHGVRNHVEELRTSLSSVEKSLRAARTELEKFEKANATGREINPVVDRIKKLRVAQKRLVDALTEMQISRPGLGGGPGGLGGGRFF